MDAISFIEGLKRRGYRVLGSGCFSTVLAYPGSNRVIKVAKQVDDWPQYVRWASAAGYAGTFAPKVFSFRQHDGWYVAVVERLDCTIAETTKAGARRIYGNLSYTMMGAGTLDAERDLEDSYPGAVAFAKAFATDMCSGFGSTDLHDANFMLRSDGTIVCTDPLSWGGTGAAPGTRLRQRDFAHSPRAPL